jgi:hypothetical protein
MSRKSTLKAAVAVLAAAVALPVIALASSGENTLTIATHQTLTSAGSAAGTFAADGDIDDSGTVQSTFSLTPQGSNLRLSGEQTLVGSLGTLHSTFTGIAGPAGARQAASGTFELDSGTGAYAGVRGHGTFTVLGDFATGNVYSVAEGQAHN